MTARPEAAIPVTPAALGRIGALVLTYNRQELLARCLEAIAGQSRAPDAAIVLDNGSTDGTADYLRARGRPELARVAAFRVERNLGSAAGFDLLFRIAYRRGYDWLWCMDDDVVAEPSALEELCAAFAGNFAAPEAVGFLVSAAVSGRGEPSNVPEIDLRAARFACPSWGDRLDRGLVKLRWATFNSIMIPRSTLLAIGGLAADFQFGGEDVDFTLRASERAPGYLVGRSKVTHLRAAGGVFSALTQTDPQRIRMAAYYYRATLYMRRRYYSPLSALKFLARCAGETLLALGSGRLGLRRASSILSGTLQGLWFVPRRPPLDAPLPATLTPWRGDTAAAGETVPARNGRQPVVAEEESSARSR